MSIQKRGWHWPRLQYLPLYCHLYRQLRAVQCHVRNVLLRLLQLFIPEGPLQRRQEVPSPQGAPQGALAWDCRSQGGGPPAREHLSGPTASQRFPPPPAQLAPRRDRGRVCLAGRCLGHIPLREAETVLGERSGTQTGAGHSGRWGAPGDTRGLAAKPLGGLLSLFTRPPVSPGLPSGCKTRRRLAGPPFPSLQKPPTYLSSAALEGTSSIRDPCVSQSNLIVLMMPNCVHSPPLHVHHRRFRRWSWALRMCRLGCYRCHGGPALTWRQPLPGSIPWGRPCGSRRPRPACGRCGRSRSRSPTGRRRALQVASGPRTSLRTFRQFLLCLVVFPW